MKRMNIHQIVEAWLESNGYDGLANTDLECGCFIGDLMPCGEANEDDCVAGHAAKNKEGQRIVNPGKGETK
jgi:hypothetical protein